MTYIGERVRILTRNDRDVSSSFPDLVAPAASLGLDRVILDGEIVALDARGAHSFGRSPGPLVSAGARHGKVRRDAYRKN